MQNATNVIILLDPIKKLVVCGVRSEEEVRTNVDCLDSEKLKSEPLNAQLQFRQIVLAVPGIDKTYICRLSKKAVLGSSDMLKDNLIVLNTK